MQLGMVSDRNIVMVGSASAPRSIVRIDEDVQIPTQQLNNDWRVNLGCFRLAFGCSNMANVLAGARIDQRSWS